MAEFFQLVFGHFENEPVFGIAERQTGLHPCGLVLVLGLGSNADFFLGLDLRVYRGFLQQFGKLLVLKLGTDMGGSHEVSVAHRILLLDLNVVMVGGPELLSYDDDFRLLEADFPPLLALQFRLLNGVQSSPQTLHLDLGRVKELGQL